MKQVELTRSSSILANTGLTLRFAPYLRKTMTDDLSPVGGFRVQEFVYGFARQTFFMMPSREECGRQISLTTIFKNYKE